MAGCTATALPVVATTAFPPAASRALPRGGLNLSPRTGTNHRHGVQNAAGPHGARPPHAGAAPARAALRDQAAEPHGTATLPEPLRSKKRAAADENERFADESAQSQFYKTFTRPIAKVLLVAVFTYQVLYWGWMKLETEEVRAETEAEITRLEASVEEYKKSKAVAETPTGGKS